MKKGMKFGIKKYKEVSWEVRKPGNGCDNAVVKCQ